MTGANPRACACVTLHGNRDSAGAIKVRTLGGDDPGLSGGQCHHEVLVKGRQEGQSQREDVMTEALRCAYHSARPPAARLPQPCLVQQGTRGRPLRETETERHRDRGRQRDD